MDFLILVTYQCFSCCSAVLTKSQGFFFFLCSPASKESCGAPEAGKGQKQDWSGLTKGIFHMMPCGIIFNKIKSWKEKEKEGEEEAENSCYENICLPKRALCVLRSCFPSCVWISLVNGNYGINVFSLCFCVDFFFLLSYFFPLIKLILTLSHESFFSTIFSPQVLLSREIEKVVEFSCLWIWNHCAHKFSHFYISGYLPNLPSAPVLAWVLLAKLYSRV